MTAPCRAQDGTLPLTMRTQQLRQHDWGGNFWHTVESACEWKASETALIICDVWDKHWSKGATRRVGEMAPKMNIVVQAARSKGVFIIHAPSDTLDFYRDSAARKRMLAAPLVPLPSTRFRPVTTIGHG